MEFLESIEWLQQSLTFGIRPGLARIEALLESLGHPEREYRVIHVAGTNGKGSVVAMMDSVLRESGLRTGRYISPHLWDYRERMAVNGEDISETDFAEVATRIRQEIERVFDGKEERPTEFEILTAMAFYYFAQQKCEYVVVETGLGGLLDSTNVVRPEVAVITNVSMDHMAYCGEKVTEIAAHKAGIIKRDCPVVTAARGDALPVIKKEARQKHARLYYWGRDFEVESRRPNPFGQVVNVKRAEAGSALLFVPFAGVHQAVNAAISTMAITVLAGNDDRITEDCLREGIAKAQWPGRFERIVHGGHTYVLDGAHNADGAEALAMTLREVYPEKKRVFVFACLEDKDMGTMVGHLFNAEDKVITVAAPTPRSRDPLAMAEMLPCEAKAATSVAEALRQAAAEADAESIIVVCGSLYILGEAKTLLAKWNAQ